MTAGKLLRRGTERFWVKGVTYGTFAPDARGRHFPALDVVAADFAIMRRAGINTVRTYTMPDEAMLDLAAEHGLAVMAGVAWPQHVAFLDHREAADDIRRSVRAQVASLARHPALLMVALGNEIPAPVVRWLGARRVEHFLSTLHADCKDVAPDGLLTYVNYPPTEYLHLPFVDVVAFNVYLHDQPALAAYLARLQCLADHKPLLVAEAGADSIREGLHGQATLTSQQLRTAFAAGACGAITFAFTDEWWRGGHVVDDWAFGLVDAERKPKPSLAAVADAYAHVPFPASERRSWPTVSVVICAYNAAATIGECLAALTRLRDQPLEVIVVDDGSTDATAEIAREFPGVRLLEAAHGGLSAARNLGATASRGEVVAYLDADAYPDEDWLTFLVQPFLSANVVAAGGPNVVPPDDPWQAQCVARAPGGPTHVLLNERTAEHVPGCNLAVRRDALLAIGGFNPIYVRAGDDVDLCWRLQAQGWQVGFAPAALVWHHHRAGVRAYWRQQVGYGEGQAWLVPRHPERFAGRHIMWHGHIYSPLPFVRGLSQPRVNTGVWGTAAFPSVYHTSANAWIVLPHTVRWQLAALLALAVGVTGVTLGTGSWSVVLALAGAAGLGLTLGRCLFYAWASDIASLPPIGRLQMDTSRLVYRLLIGWLHVVQPFARGWGQLRGHLTRPASSVDPLPQVSTRRAAWRQRPAVTDVRRAVLLLAQRPVERLFWSERWIAATDLLSRLTDRLRRSPLTSALEPDDGWQLGHDVRVSVGWLARLDIRVLVEDHGGDRHLIRVGHRLRPAPAARAALMLCAIGQGTVAAGGLASVGLPLFAVVAVLIVAWLVWDTARVLAEAERIAAELMDELGVLVLPQPLPSWSVGGIQQLADHPVRKEEGWSA